MFFLFFYFLYFNIFENIVIFSNPDANPKSLTLCFAKSL